MLRHKKCVFCPPRLYGFQDSQSKQRVFPFGSIKRLLLELSLHFDAGTEFLNNWSSCLEGLIGNTNLCVCYCQYLIFLLVFVYLPARPCACFLSVSLFFSIAPDIWKGFLHIRVGLAPPRSIQKWNSIPRHANRAFTSKPSDKHAPLRVVRLWLVSTFIASFFKQPKTENIDPLPLVL